MLWRDLGKAFVIEQQTGKKRTDRERKRRKTTGG